MEERIIDDEYGRGIRLKKTKDGYVDATDEQLEDEEVDEVEEMQFAFPMLDGEEDDEDLATLSPEEALKLRQEKMEREKARKAEYERLCAEGFALLETESFRSAELKFEKALHLDEKATDASVGYWRAKTENFKKPDVLVDEYAEASIESLEYDLGIEAVDRIKTEYQAVFKQRYQELCDEETPLAEGLEKKQAHRRRILKERLKSSIIVFLCVTVPMIVLGILTAVIGMKNFAVRENTYILPTIILGVCTFAFFLAFIITANKWINVLRMLGANERLDSTEDGQRLLEIRDYKQIYVCLLKEDKVEEN